MPGVYSHNRGCDAKHWFGEVSLGGFEEYVFIDDLLDITPLTSYEEAIENFWPLFIAEV